MSDWEIINAPWQDAPPAGVDCIIGDPPYDARTHDNGRRGAKGKAVSEATVKSFDPIAPEDIAPRLVSLARRWVVLFCSVEQLGDYRRACPVEYVRGAAWVKTNPAPQFTGDRPGQWGEGIAVLHPKGKKRWAGGGRAGAFVYPNARFDADAKLHETQKPLALMLEIVRLFSEPGDLVWDPYCGSGTTGAACLRLGRRFIGHEIQKAYADTARDRLAAEANGLSLTAAHAGQVPLFSLETD